MFWVYILSTKILLASASKLTFFSPFFFLREPIYLVAIELPWKWPSCWDRWFLLRKVGKVGLDTVRFVTPTWSHSWVGHFFIHFLKGHGNSLTHHHKFDHVNKQNCQVVNIYIYVIQVPETSMNWKKMVWLPVAISWMTTGWIQALFLFVLQNGSFHQRLNKNGCFQVPGKAYYVATVESKLFMRHQQQLSQTSQRFGFLVMKEFDMPGFSVENWFPACGKTFGQCLVKERPFGQITESPTFAACVF